MRIARTMLLLLVACIAVGCSTNRPAYTPVQAGDDAVIYLYRTGNLAGAVTSLPLRVDGQLAGTLKNDMYTYAIVPPGEYLVSSETSSDISELRVTTERGTAYYVRADVIRGLLSGRPRLTLVVPSAGRIEVAGTSFAGTALAPTSPE
ncbi:MAG: DUF2846 domain-containing protein [Planctomycetota bacterium]